MGLNCFFSICCSMRSSLFSIPFISLSVFSIFLISSTYLFKSTVSLDALVCTFASFFDRNEDLLNFRAESSYSWNFCRLSGSEGRSI